MPAEPIQLEGTLALCSQEGGYAAPDLLINGGSFTALMWTGFKHLEKQGEIGQLPGRWRLTLEQIEEEEE